jgi:hypothetical protein
MYISKDSLNKSVMKKMKFTIAVFTLLVITTLCFAQKEGTETLTVPLSNPGKTYTLKVHVLSGSIKVTGYDGKDIIVNATPNAEEDGDDREPAEKGMKRISTGGGFEVTAKEADNNVTVSSGSIEKRIDLDLKVPQDVKLKLGTVNEGVVSVSNIKGEIEVNNVNDDIELSEISGSAVANTVNGNVIVVFTSVDPQASMAFSTLNGDVKVTFPAATKANLKLKSDMGDVYSDFEIDIDKTPSKTEKTSEPGMYKVKKDNWVYGKINGGGPEMIFKNMHGDIYVKKSSK